MTFIEQSPGFVTIHKPLKDVLATVKEALERVEKKGTGLSVADQHVIIKGIEEAVFRSRAALNARMYKEQLKVLQTVVSDSEDKNAGLIEKN